MTIVYIAIMYIGKLLIGFSLFLFLFLEKGLEGGAEGKERISHAGSTLSMEPDKGFNIMTLSQNQETEALLTEQPKYPRNMFLEMPFIRWKKSPSILDLEYFYDCWVSDLSNVFLRVFV